ncbi:aspartate/glutamate racemase family protein [Nocardiopsis sediminis]|uniref:Aspartate/glutamate racemase family protein n=1 Tax=Nocardiopsis sediminis TaxID=1778267 RepID=A0ABV8FJI7_9ACTN
MPPSRPLLAMIHAVARSAELADAAVRERFPEAVPWHLFDGRLLEEVEHAGGLTPGLRSRMLRLIGHAFTEGADAVLLTCSSYGPVVEEARRMWDRPIDRPDDALFDRVLRSGARRVALICTSAAAVAPAVDGLAMAARSRDRPPEAVPLLCPTTSGAADAGALAARLAEAGVDAVALAQYSLAPLAGAVAAATGLSVHAGPEAAAGRLRARLLGIEEEVDR